MPYNDCTEAFAVPGDDSVIDMVHPNTGCSVTFGQTLAQIQARYPGAEVVNFSAWLAAKAERQHTPVQWAPCTKARYDYMLNVLPPEAYERGGFLVGEPTDSDASNGQPRYAAFRQWGRVFYEADRPMTRAEFRRALHALTE